MVRDPKATVKWNQPLVEAVRDQLFAELERVVERAGIDEGRAFLNAELTRSGGDMSPEGQARLFWAALSLLSLHESYGGLDGPQVNRLQEMAETVLFTQGIQADSSKLSYLHGELQQILSRLRGLKGEHWEAIRLNHCAQGLGRKNPPFGQAHHALATALRAMRQGNLAFAREGFALVESSDLPRAYREQAQLAHAQSLRLSGDRDTAATVLKDLEEGPEALSDEGRLEVAWERICLEVQGSGDLQPMIQAVGRQGWHEHSSFILEAALWVRAHPKRKWHDRVIKAESIRRKFSGSFRRGGPHAFLLECVAKLEQACDNEIPLSRRLEDLSKLQSDTSRFGSIDKEVLFWAAVARWYVRYRQPLMAGFAHGEYRALSLRLSDGRSADCLGLMGDLEGHQWYSSPRTQRMADMPKTGVWEPVDYGTWSRMGSVTRIAAGVAARKIRRQMIRISANPDQTQQLLEKEYARGAERVTEELTKMKGPVVKLGQALGQVALELPENVRRTLVTLRDACAPLPTEVMKAVVSEELGGPIEGFFAEFSEEPLAAASLGQVHRARTKRGDDVVVKIQYPKVEEAISSDLRLFRFLVPMFQPFYPGMSLRDLTDAFEEMVRLECDYTREADFQERFREAFQNDPDIVIPRVHHDFSSGRVLTMDYLEGFGFDEFMETASQAERNQAGRIIYRFNVESLYRHGLINGDIHQGNFLFLEGGAVGFVDFGFSQIYPQERIELWKRVYRAGFVRDKEGYSRGMQELGYVADPERFDYEALWKMFTAYIMPALDSGVFRFTEDYVDQRTRSVALDAQSRRHLNLPTEELRFQRNQLFEVNILAALGAEADWGAILKPLLVPGEDTAQEEPKRLSS